MPWWETVLLLMAAALAIWGFISLVRFDTWVVTRRTDRRARDMYANYAGLSRKQRRVARQHADQRHGHEDA